MKVNILSTAPPTECGIGITNHYLMEGMKQALKIRDLSKKDIYLHRIRNPKSINPFHFINILLKARHCDILHIQYNHDCFGTIGPKINGFQNIFVYPLARLLRINLVTTFHEISDLSNSFFIRRIFYRMLNFFPLHFSDHIIVTTEEAKELLISQDKISPNNISVIPLGAIEKVKKMDQESARRLLDIPIEAKVITQFGFIDSNKGHDKIINILDNLQNTYFIIAGSSRSGKGERYRRSLCKKIREKELQDRVKFLGFVKEEDYPKIMGASDLLVFPYSDITSSLALTTAISYNVPILTSDIKPFEQFKKRFGGIITADVNDQNFLLLSIQAVLYSKEAVNTIIKNQKDFIANYNWKEIASRTFSVYKECYVQTKSMSY